MEQYRGISLPRRMELIPDDEEFDHTEKSCSDEGEGNGTLDEVSLDSNTFSPIYELSQNDNRQYPQFSSNSEMMLSNSREDIQNKAYSSEYDFSAYAVLYLNSPNASGSAPFRRSVSNTQPGTQTEKNMLRHNDTDKLFSQRDSDKEIVHKNSRMPATRTENTNNLGERSPRAVQLRYESEYACSHERKIMGNRLHRKLKQTP